MRQLCESMGARRFGVIVTTDMDQLQTILGFFDNYW